jgi:hypothetical protein
VGYTGEYHASTYRERSIADVSVAFNETKLSISLVSRKTRSPRSRRAWTTAWSELRRVLSERRSALA